MNRTIVLLIIFLLLGGLSFWFLSNGEDDRSTLVGWDRNFKVENTDEIFKIFIADRKGERVTLERKNGYWLYNDQWAARPNAMENLLDAIGRVEMEYKPPQAMMESMIRDLAANGIKVELYDSENKLIRSYYVGGSTPDERGTYMIMEDAEQPYVTHLPGWTGNLRFRYNLKGEDWRDKSVFHLTPNQIRSISVAYPKQRSKSFILELVEEGFAVRPYYEITPPINQPLNNGRVLAFLDGFESLGAEAFENQNPRRDSVRQLVPFSIITVTDTEGQSREVRLFPIYPRRLAGTNSEPLVGADVVERYFADLSSGDFMLVQHRVMKKILWAYDFFFDET